MDDTTRDNLDDDHEIPFADLVDGLTTASLPDGDNVLTIFAIVKAQSSDGEIVWAGRTGGPPLSSEELLGALEGLATSIRNDLAEGWDW